jgi:hypothetical protein
VTGILGTKKDLTKFRVTRSKFEKCNNIKRASALCWCLFLFIIDIMNFLRGISMSDIKGIPNKLINEKSPYLLQHAYNPVNWYLWGEKAFGKAKKEDKPVFLSIIYSTCHWCHVFKVTIFI